MKTHIEYPDIFFLKYNSPYHIEMGTYVLINLLWAGGSVAPAQLTSLRWNWGIFPQTCFTCLEGLHRKDSSAAHPCRAIDMAWEPRIPSSCSLKAITHCKHLGPQGLFRWLMSTIIVTNEFVQLNRSLSLIWSYVKRGPSISVIQKGDLGFQLIYVKAKDLSSPKCHKVEKDT